VRFSLARFGGVAALDRPPLVVETAALPAGHAARLQALTERACFFELPADLGPSHPVPDALGYQLSVTGDDGRAHCVSFGAGAAPEALRELLAAIRAAAAR
jgi:hypothetical protein